MRICTESYKLIKLMKIPIESAPEGSGFFNLWPRQEDYLDLLHMERILVYLKTRQVAGTRLTMADSIACAISIPNWIFQVFSKTGPDAEENLQKAKEMFYSLPKEIISAAKVKKDTSEELAFENGSRIISFPANRGCGFTSDRVLIDEAGKIVPSTSKTTLEKLLKEVEPTVQKMNGQLIILGTANGYNLFEKYYSRAKKGLGGLKAFFFSSEDDPTFTPEKRQQEVEKWGEDHVKQEYPRNDLEAFLMSGRCRFNRSAISTLKLANTESEIGFLEEVNGIVKFNLHPEGWFKIWRRPADLTEVFATGADIAEGIVETDKNDPDFSTACVLDRNAVQVAEIQCRLEPDVFAVELVRIAKFFNNCLLGVERNKDGLGVLKKCKELGYTNLYSQEDFNLERHIKEKKLGWTTDKISKPMLIGYGDELIRYLKVTIKSEFLIKELMTYVIFNDGSTGAEEGCHDDLVMAFMIALWMLKYVPEKNPLPKIIDAYTDENHAQDKQLQEVRGY
jgi:hypothetical protein